MHAVGDIDWSPVSSTTFGAVTADGSIVVFDLSVNKYKPIANQKVVSKGKLTRLEFNPKNPLVVIGDDRGGTSCLKLSPNLSKVGKGPEPEKLAHVIRILSELSK
jgi:dynein intermediate chain 1